MLLRIVILVGWVAGVCLGRGMRYARQAARPPLNEAITEPEGRFLDPALLSLMFSSSGILPSLGSSTMNNAFSALCTYPYIYYYYPMCMGGSGGGMYPPYPSNTSPSFASPSNSYPHFSPASNGVESAGPSGFDANPASTAFGGPNHHSYNPGHYMNPYAWPTAQNEPNTNNHPSSSANGPDTAAASGGAANNSPVAPPNNPGSSSSSGLQPQVPASFPRTKGYSPRGSPILSEEPSVGPLQPEPLLRSRLASSSPSFAVHPRDASLLPMRMFGPLTDARQEANQSKANENWVEVKKVLKSFGKSMIRKGFSGNVTRDFEHYLSVGMKLIEASQQLGDRLNLSDAAQLDSVRLSGNRSESLQVILGAFVNSTKMESGACISLYFCQAARYLRERRLNNEMDLLHFIAPFTSHLLGKYHYNAEVSISKGVASGKGDARSCSNNSCTTFPDY